MSEMLVKGGTIEAVTIARGPFRAEILNLGAALRILEAPDRNGDSANVTLGYRDVEEYRSEPRFYGAVAGRYANRIGGATFSLDGRAYALSKNDGENSLHSGPLGLDQVFWDVVHRDDHSVTYSTLCPAGTNGFPGNLHIDVAYVLEEDGLAVTFTATTDSPTVVNLTHHAYFNLAGEASGAAILDHWLQIPASHTTPTDAALIPTGAFAEVSGGPFDFRRAKPIGRDIGADDIQLKQGQGYDHNFVLDAPPGRMRRAATVFDPGSGRVLEVHSDQPGIQLYTGNHLAGGAPGTSGVTYPARGGFCLEPQKHPDSPNKPNFPSARLNPGEKYIHAMAFRFRTAADESEAFPA
jgi:aldose 1-epimerase